MKTTKQERGQLADMGEFQERNRDAPACLMHFSKLPCPLCLLENERMEDDDEKRWENGDYPAATD